VAIPYPAEYRIMQPDLDLLAAIAAAGSAATLSGPAAAFDPAGLPRYSTDMDIWPTMALLALLLYPLDVAIRILYAPPVPGELPGRGGRTAPYRGRDDGDEPRERAANDADGGD